jgi:hypothetical protein
MMQEPLTQQGFDNLTAQLKFWVRELHLLVEDRYPAGMVYDPDTYPAGSRWDGPETADISKRIGDVTEAFSVLQERLGLPVNELSLRQQHAADQEAARNAPWPAAASVRTEMLDAMARIVHDVKAEPRDRRGAAKLILAATRQDRELKLLEALEQSRAGLIRRVEALERRAAETKRAPAQAQARAATTD